MKRIIFFFLMACLEGSAQTVIPFSDARWKIKAKEAVAEEHLGKTSLKLVDGSVSLPDAGFKNGIIEFDIALKRDRYFPGIGFRMQDKGNGEIYYLRPHQSGNPDAMQYYPEYNGAGSWQLYYGEGFNKAHVLPFDRWLHIKMLILGNRAEIYFDDEKDPVLSARLKRPVKAGMISLMNDGPVEVHLAGFSYTATDEVTFKTQPKPVEPLPKTVITTWQVSAPFDEKLVKDRPLLNTAGFSSLSWQSMATDERGIIDLSMLAGTAPGKNTMFAKLVIESDKATVKKLSFGFSDRAWVYFNNKLLYSGADVFMSRDYRFLGTIGYFDTVYLELKKGRNELWIAVSEDFGGWGLQAKLEDL